MAMKLDSYLQLFFLGCFYFSGFFISPAEAAVRKYQFDVGVFFDCVTSFYNEGLV